MPVPRPSPVFVVGLAGHRTARLARASAPGHDAPAAIGRHLAAVFGAVSEAVGREVAAQAAWYSGEPARCRLVSSLADGADALAVRALPPDWGLTAVLPMPPEAFRDRLLSDQPEEAAAEIGAEHAWARERADTVLSLPAAEEDEDESVAYARAADLMLRQCDLLVAVWDGEFDGKAGGTGDSVTRALGWGIPVVVVEADGRHPPRLVTRAHDVRRRDGLAGALTGPLAEAVAAALALPERPESGDSPSGEETRGRGADKLAAYLGETIPTRSWASAYHLLVFLAQPRRWRLILPIAGEAGTRRDWARFLAAMPASGGFAERLDRILLPRVAAADALATSYGHKYRSAYVMAYVLSIVAVTVALVGLALHSADVRATIVHERWFVPIELVTVLMILAIIGHGHARKWHDRWLDTRALAETLRCLRIVGPVGGIEPIALGAGAANPGAGWMLWYLRATVRELGLPAGALDVDAQRQVLVAMREAELERQITYHGENAARLTRLDHGLHHLGKLSFVTTAIILALLLAGLILEWRAPHWLPDRFPDCLAFTVPVAAFMTTWLPAFGAMASGIRFTGDFEGFAARSRSTAAELRALRETYETAVSRISLDATGDVLARTARILSADLQGWRTLYDRKRLVLPG